MLSSGDLVLDSDLYLNSGRRQIRLVHLHEIDVAEEGLEQVRDRVGTSVYGALLHGAPFLSAGRINGL